MHPIRLFAPAILAGAVASALAGSASAQAVFTTLHSAGFSLSSLNGSPVSSSTSYTGPTSGFSGLIYLNPMSVPNTGAVRLGMTAVGTWDRFGMNWVPTGGVANSYTVQMNWDVTFNSTLGGVMLDIQTLSAGSLSVTPLGGSSSAFNQGDILGNGRYTFTWDFVETSPATGVTQFLLFSEAAPPSTGVPLPGAAGLAAAGLVSLSRRRRR